MVLGCGARTVDHPPDDGVEGRVAPHAPFAVREKAEVGVIVHLHRDRALFIYHSLFICSVNVSSLFVQLIICHDIITLWIEVESALRCSRRIGGRDGRASVDNGIC